MTSERLGKADTLLKEASRRLEECRHAIGSENYDMARGLLEFTNDFRVGLEEKSVFSRHRQTQVYLDQAQETHKRIEHLTSGLY